jgi:hypothetical protein
MPVFTISFLLQELYTFFSLLNNKLRINRHISGTIKMLDVSRIQINQSLTDNGATLNTAPQ